MQKMSNVARVPFRCALTIRSDTRYLAPLREWIGAVARIVGNRSFPRRAVRSCTLALIEAVDNAIFHAHARRSHLPIRIAIAVQNGQIEIEVVDRGVGPGKLKEPHPDEMVSSGRGLFLIGRLTDRVASSVKNGKHSLRMTFRI